ncbi:glycine cleavage system protein GcvH [Aestuariirhabdus litorea]|uniref:Glycine cleavage system H protein n=1 Tax=Aestuariirhabdus litorea TaxID=2528527 RepID=A0A3P3VL14_9GAMM|nr:glycine cleavage system protein GcvH [Aestuariirhabdus litorea]RRJ83007.1 glycine cleavage system protein GcvH [Aestuariirhabdus litorea]RWW93165.1 glycine cleavage system protein GcvH [Endozoicomonadaceae bacterium GTF-13]
MSNTPDNLRFTKSHEWVLDNGDGTVTMGITDHAQELLGDVVFVELPELERQVEAGEEFSLVESVKAASDIYSPVSGEVIAVNDALEDAPETVNEEPYGGGWIAKLRLADGVDLAELLDAAAYADLVAESH